MEWLFVGFVALFMVPAIVVGFSHDHSRDRGGTIWSDPQIARLDENGRLKPGVYQVPGVQLEARRSRGAAWAIVVSCVSLLVSIAALVVACVMIAGGGG